MPNQRRGITFTESGEPGLSVEFTASRPPVSFGVKWIGCMSVLYWIYWLLRSQAYPFLHICASLSQVCMLLYCLWYVEEESMLIIKDFGVQLTKVYSTGHKEVSFIEREAIQAIFIHEYFDLTEVHFAFALKLTHNHEKDLKLILAFRHVRPGLEALRHCYIRCCQLEASFVPKI